MMRIMIADDHPIFRNGLRHLIDEESDMVVSDEAENGKQVLKLLEEKQYDVVLLDLDMPVISGLEVLTKIKECHPRLPVLILSFYPEEQYALRALKLGSSGYLTKDSAAEELVIALHRVVAGKKYITTSLAERMSLLLEEETDIRPHERLSEREYQVLLKLSKGESTMEIAGELNLSPKTVSTYKSRIFEKMEMTTDAQIIRYAIKERLIN